MQLSLEVIDALRAIALYTAGWLREATITPNKFWDAGGNILPRYDIGDIILKCYTGSGVISFYDVRPSKIISLEISEPAEFNTEQEKHIIDVFRNATSEPFSKEETYTEESSRTEKNDIMAELSTSIKSKVGGSYAGFNAELEASLSAKLGVNHSETVEHKDSDVVKTKIDVPAWTSISVEQDHEISDTSQHVSLKCEIDASVQINGGWKKRFDSLSELELYMRGGGGGKGLAQELDKFVQTRKFEHFDLHSKPFSMPSMDRVVLIEQERISRNVSTGKIELTETAINHGDI